MGRRCGGEAAAAAASQAIARGLAAGRRDPHARRTGRRVTQHSVAAPVRLQSPSPPRWPQHTNAWAWARATGSGFVVAGAAGLGDDLVAAGQWGADVVAGGGWSVGQIIYHEKMMAAIGSNMDGQKLFSCLGWNGPSHSFSAKCFSSSFSILLEHCKVTYKNNYLIYIYIFLVYSRVYISFVL